MPNYRFIGDPHAGQAPEIADADVIEAHGQKIAKGQVVAGAEFAGDRRFEETDEAVSPAPKSKGPKRSGRLFPGRKAKK